MSSSSDVTAKCSHCGFPLSPSHVGPCPKCGKAGKSVFVNLVDSIAISDRVSAIVNTSTGSAFTTHHQQPPEWLLEASKSIAHDITPVVKDILLEVLEQYDKTKEAEEKRPTRRAKGIGEKLLWIIVVHLFSPLTLTSRPTRL